MQPPLIEVPGAGELSTALISSCGSYRYRLDRVWNASRVGAVWILLNPSTATADVDDPTIRRVRSFSIREGCGSLTVLNLFGLRATDPRALRQHPDPVGPDNDQVIREELRGCLGVVVCAWGVHGTLHGRDRQILALLHGLGVTPLCLGTTKAGQPRHPLYVPSSTPSVEYQAPARVAAQPGRGGSLVAAAAAAADGRHQTHTSPARGRGQHITERSCHEQPARA
jgi:hypothetical protein